MRSVGMMYPITAHKTTQSNVTEHEVLHEV